ncbi:MAG: hypothetical protein PHU31_02505 [Anaerotignum sp.]|nr:hypothetical protein [Anaerotignum sp.]
MQNLQNDPIYRNADRRSEERHTKRESKHRKHAETAETIAAIKILLLWFFCAVAVTVFIVAMQEILPYQFVLKWILIISFTVSLVSAIYAMTEEIKKSLRHCNAEKGQTK